MRTFTFGRCIALLDVDPKVFRRWIKEDLGLSEKDQVSKADSRVRYLTEEQLKKLAALHEKTLPPDDQLPDEKEEASPGAYKLLDDRLTVMEESHKQQALEMSVATGDLEKVLARLGEAEQRLARSGEQYKELFARTEHIAILESQLQTLSVLPGQMTALEVQLQILPTLMGRFTHLEAQVQAASTTSQSSLEDQRIAEIEAQYQQRIAELESQLAQYQQSQTGQPAKKTTGKKRRTSIKKLPATLVARRAFAELHHVPDTVVATACKSGSIAAVQGKWLYQRRVIYQAFGERGKHDFYQRYHQRPDFTPCEECPHSLAQV